MNKEKIKKEVISWIKTIAISLVIALVITSIVRPTIVKESSMYPTLIENDFMFVNRVIYKIDEPQRGDIVVFDSDLEIVEGSGEYKKLVKRIIGLPGEHVMIMGGNVYIDDELYSEDYIDGMPTFGDVDMTVPSGHYFVMGDNRPVSLDSRSDRVGAVSEEAIYGKIFVRLFPVNKIQLF